MGRMTLAKRWGKNDRDSPGRTKAGMTAPGQSVKELRSDSGFFFSQLQNQKKVMASPGLSLLLSEMGVIKCPSPSQAGGEI